MSPYTLETFLNIYQAARSKYSHNSVQNLLAQEEQTRLSAYIRRDVTNLNTKNHQDQQTYWQTLTESIYILHFHQNAIVRHEAAFVLADFPYKNNLEKNLAIRTLRIACRFDQSIVVKHETAEALGEFYGIASIGAAADMAKILQFPQLYHQDVVQTAEESFVHILNYLKEQGYTSTIEELQQWRSPQFNQKP